MKLYFIKKPCPTCKTKIGIGLFSDRGKIIRCPNCGELVMDNPKTNYLLIALIIFGILLSMGLRHLLGESSWRDILIVVILFAAFVISIRLIVVKRDLVIRNRQTNELSYIDNSDWNDIEENAKGKENNFEIVEKL
jgi:hypothetical protein